VGGVVREFEAEVCRLTGARHAVAFSSCTAGLMLAPKAMNLPSGGEVIVPSFTFAATAQALAWNGLVPVFCDCLPGTCALDPEDVEQNITGKTVAFCPVYIFGLPPDMDGLLDLGRRKGLPVYFDSAQGLGATYKARQAGGFGVAEVFSLSPTKVVTAVEGGLVTTNDDELADRLRAKRDYGKDPKHPEDMAFLGLSARMNELHATVGLLSVRKIDELVKARLIPGTWYRMTLNFSIPLWPHATSSVFLPPSGTWYRTVPNAWKSQWCPATSFPSHPSLRDGAQSTSQSGAGVSLNTGCTVDHHNVIGDYAHIAPGAHLGGDVTAGEGAFVYIGASVAPQRKVGAWSTAGGGVIRDAPRRHRRRHPRAIHQASGVSHTLASAPLQITAPPPHAGTWYRPSPK
jgi:hypothetical protein